ncbi:hypothetical protein ACS0PU_010568 [Formica fusca]
MVRPKREREGEREREREHGLAFTNPAARSLELFPAVARLLPATIIAAIRCETPEETFLARQQLQRAKSERWINSALSLDITLSLLANQMRTRLFAVTKTEFYPSDAEERERERGRVRSFHRF